MHAAHEPEPTLATAAVTMDGHGEAARALLGAKVGATWAQLSALRPGEVYAETSHMSIWWLEALMESGLAHEHQVELIVLRRYLPAMLRSRMLLRQLDPHADAGKAGARKLRSLGWLHTTSSCSATVQPIAPDGEQTQAELLMGYLADVEAKTDALVRRYAGRAPGECRVHEAATEELDSPEGVRRLLRSLRLDARRQPQRASPTSSQPGEPDARHRRLAEKRAETDELSLPRCEALAAAFVERCARQRIALPALPHLDRSWPRHPGRADQEAERTVQGARWWRPRWRGRACTVT